jgi:hypothetical protein
VNRQQEVFYAQARSDWWMYRHLRAINPRVACHELHYLQMATEKFGKAYLWGSAKPPDPTHRVFKRSVQKIRDSRDCWRHLQFADRRHFRTWVNEVLPLVERIERLAPALAGDGPNPEYPWPANAPVTAPVEFNFPVWHELETGRGRKLIGLIQLLMDSFPAWA